MPVISHYFPEFSEKQIALLGQLMDCVREWNAKINLVSRKDMEQIEVHHVLHSLGIYKAQPFPQGSRILDVGTGGGFPGLVLAIVSPDCRFVLVDSIGKKIMVVKDIIARLGLTNATAMQARAEDVPGQFDFITGRAVTRLPEFISWVRGKMLSGEKDGVKRGLLYLKGADVEAEMGALQVQPVAYHLLSDFFKEDYFAEKAVVYLATNDLPNIKAVNKIAEKWIAKETKHLTKK